MQRIRAAGIVGVRARNQINDHLRLRKTTGMNYAAFDVERLNNDFRTYIFNNIITVWTRRTRRNRTRQINMIQSTLMSITENAFNAL
jgi:hypothetical protein